MKMMRVAAFLVASTFSLLATAQDITGRWTTVDDNTGQPRSVVQITVKDGVATGHIVDLYDRSRLDKTCEKCTDDRKGQKIVGLEIIRGMRDKGGTWSGGTILDPENGKVYDCKLWVEDGTLKVRGYVAFFYRTQTWVR